MINRKDPMDDPRMRTVRHELSLRSVFSLIAIGAGLWLLGRIWQILLLLIIALILAGTLSPLVDWLVRRRVKRTPALGLVLLALVMAIAGLGALIIPAVVAQVSGLITSAPAIQVRLAEYLTHVPALARGVNAVRNAQPERFLAPLGSYALTFAGAAATIVVLALTTVVLTFYLLADAQRVKGFVFALLPRRFHLRSARILLDMETVVGGYVRGQALTSLLIGLFVFAVLWVAGTPNPLALAVVAAFADLIPFIGGVLALVPATLATLTQGALPALLVFVAIGVYMQLESHILIPRIYGQTLRLSPLAVLIALLIGGQLLGIVGALLALPLAAGLRVVIEQLRIDLPGEQPGEVTERVLDAEAEASYAEQTLGLPAVEAAEVATEMAEQEQAAMGSAAVPIENRSDIPRVPPYPPS
jgi:predicted PurR-regulated permease PerM